jgi:hypothetical protein
MSNEELTDDSDQQSEEQAADGNQPAEQSEEQPSESDQSVEQSEEQVAEEQPAEQSDDTPASDSEQSTEQPGEEPAQDTDRPADSDQPAEQSEEQSDQSEQPDQTGEQAAEAGGSSEAVAGQPVATGELSAKRQSMLDLIDKWMPTSLNNPRVPEGETQDLMAKAGWTKATGQYNKKLKDDGKVFATSCGDILAAMLRFWGSNFVGAFNIRDQDSKGRSPGAKGLGFYVEADGAQSPQPGDIIVLRNGVGKSSAGSTGHVGILVEAGETEWRTADGGGGALPDQTASVTTRTVRFEDSIPILKSPTDLKEKQLDGWVDLDKLEQTE